MEARYREHKRDIDWENRSKKKYLKLFKSGSERQAEKESLDKRQQKKIYVFQP